MKSGIKGIIIVGILLLLTGSYVFAELSPVVYQHMQQDAEEYYIIEAVQVRTPLRLFSRNKPVIVTATVQEVIRSSLKISSNTNIEIRYTNYRPPKNWVGPRSIPILKRGNTYHAFLTWSEADGYFVPAARGASFDYPYTYD